MSWEQFGPGQNTLQLWLPSGRAEVVDPITFVRRRLAKEVVSHDVNVLHQLDPPSAIVTDLSEPPTTSVSVRKREIRLRPHPGELDRFALDQLKTLLANKPVEFRVGALTMEGLHDLAVKHMEHFGGDDSSILLAELNRYLRLVAVIDDRALRLYKHERKALLVDLRPDLWVAGRYDSHEEFFRSIQANTRYSR